MVVFVVVEYSHVVFHGSICSSGMYSCSIFMVVFVVGECSSLFS